VSGRVAARVRFHRPFQRSKSSLLNMLAGEQGLARVSPTPGFTKLINVFTMNKCWRLVDCRGGAGGGGGRGGGGGGGGGRKSASRAVRRRIGSGSPNVSDYLENRPNLCLVFALIESGLAPQEMDIAFVEWLVRHAVPFVLVFTKTDKVSAVTAQTKHRGLYRAHFGLVRKAAGGVHVFGRDSAGVGANYAN